MQLALSLSHLLECVPKGDFWDWRVHLRSKRLDEARLTDECGLRELFIWIGELEVTTLVGADLGTHWTVIGDMVLEKFIRDAVLTAAIDTLEDHARSPLIEVIVVKWSEDTVADWPL